MDDMMVDSPEAATPANPATPVVEERAMYVSQPYRSILALFIHP
jgi:hypothetical protein